jgi:hypothetical protein
VSKSLPSFIKIVALFQEIEEEIIVLVVIEKAEILFVEDIFSEKIASIVSNFQFELLSKAFAFKTLGTALSNE